MRLQLLLIRTDSLLMLGIVVYSDGQCLLAQEGKLISKHEYYVNVIDGRYRVQRQLDKRDVSDKSFKLLVTRKNDDLSSIVVR